MKYENTIKYLEQLDDETLMYAFKDACSYDAMFEECELFTLDDLREYYYDALGDILEDLIKIGETDYYYADAYGWHGLSACEVHDHLTFYMDDLAAWLYDNALFYYDNDASEFVFTCYADMPDTLDRDEDFLLALLKDLAYNNCYIGLLNNADKLHEVVESY